MPHIKLPNNTELPTINITIVNKPPKEDEHESRLKKMLKMKKDKQQDEMVESLKNIERLTGKGSFHVGGG